MKFIKLLLLAIIVPLAMMAMDRPQRAFERLERQGGRSGSVPPTYLEFAPASGAGLPVAENLCDALAAEVPNWSTPVDGGAGNWCLGGNGQEVAGSQVDFEPFGSPEAVSVTVCPSGPDCATKSALQLDGTSQATQATTNNAPSGDLTVCGLYRSVGAGNESIIDKNDGAVAGQAGISILYVPGALNQFNVCKTNAECTALIGGPQPQLVPTFSCMTYKYVTDGTSVLRGYENGTQSVASTAAVGPLQNNSATPFRVGARNYTGVPDYMGGEVFGAFYVDQELSAAQIAAIARRVLADQPKALIRGSPSLALTYTRTGSMFCSKADNTGSILPANRPCISQNGLLVEAGATNLALRSQELDNAAWSNSGGTITATANYAVAPDGTKTAERLVFPASSSSRQQTITAADGTYDLSFYVKGTSGSGNIGIYLYNTGTNCAYTNTAWTRCNKTGTVSGGGSFVIQVTNDPAGDADDVLVWGVQVETGSVATGYIPTTSAAATRGAAVPYFDMGAGALPLSRFSAAATAVSHSHTGNIAQAFRLSGFQIDTAGKGLWLYSSAGGPFRCYLGNDSTAATATSSASISAGDRLVCASSGTALTGSIGSTVLTPAVAADGPFTAARWFDIGNHQGYTIGAFNGRISRVCLDPRPTRCR